MTDERYDAAGAAATGAAENATAAPKPASRPRRRPTSRVRQPAPAPTPPTMLTTATIPATSVAPIPAPSAAPASENRTPAAPASGALSALGAAAPTAEAAAGAPTARHGARPRRGGQRHRGHMGATEPAEAEAPTHERVADLTMPAAEAPTPSAPLATIEASVPEPGPHPPFPEPPAPIPAPPLPPEPVPAPPPEEQRADAPMEVTAGSPAPSRYRFGRAPRTIAFAAPAPRVERLSGPRSAPEAAPPEATPPEEPLAEEPLAEEPLAEEPLEAASSVLAEQRPTPTEFIPQAPGIAPTPSALMPDEPPLTSQEIEPEREHTEPAGVAGGQEAEQAEQAAVRRRRRRRRGSARSVGDELEEPVPLRPEAAAARAGAATLDVDLPEVYELPLPHDPANGAAATYMPEVEEVFQPYSPGGRERQRAAGWGAGEASPQGRQPASPFASPEPSFARGFGPQPASVAGPARESALRAPRGRAERDVDVPPMSANQLSAVLTTAISQQTDRLLNELRYQQTPPGMTVMLPPLPSTERVGIFVDVANLLYSARGMRVSMDFGRLLDFLRGNRRLVRAHAYAPTNPDPHADQAFLVAVKGLGYRITTKNYKTFASGAKKADMDLDLCMDIVRLVDAHALDSVVLVSGDSDFLPLLEYCSDHGVRVEVAAFDDAAAAILRQSCDLFINLSMVEDIRDQEEPARRR